jgi:hypothetical protein
METSRISEPLWRLVGSAAAAGSSGRQSEAVIGIGRNESAISVRALLLCLRRFTGPCCAACDSRARVSAVAALARNQIRSLGGEEAESRDEVRFLRECTARSDAADVCCVPGVERQDSYCVGMKSGRTARLRARISARQIHSLSCERCCRLAEPWFAKARLRGVLSRSSILRFSTLKWKPAD